MCHDTWSSCITSWLCYVSVDSHTTRTNNIKWGGYFVLVYLSVFWTENSNTGKPASVSHTHQIFMLIVAASLPCETCTAAHTSITWNNKRNTWICIANHLCLLPVRRLRHSWGSSGLHTLYFYRLHLKSYSQATWISEITRLGSTGCLKHIKLIMPFSLISVPSMRFV